MLCDNKKINYHRLLYYALSVPYVMMIFALVSRLFLSVELSDEVYVISGIYHIYLGKIPLMTSWDGHTGYCLLIPLFLFFRLLSPGMEGIVLFFRLMYLLFTVVCVGLIAFLLYRRWKDIRVLYAVSAIIFLVPSSAFSINYNSWTVYTLMLAAMILFTSDRTRPEGKRYFCLGILMCLACIMYPTVAVTAVLLALWIIRKDNGGYRYRKAVWYICGGALPALIFLGWIFANGSVPMFSEAVKGILSSPHEQTKGAFLPFVRQTFYYSIKKFFQRRFSIVFASYVMGECFLTVFKVRKAFLWKTVLFMSYVILSAIFARNLNNGHFAWGCFLAFAVFICFEGWREIWKEYSDILLLLLLFILTYSFTSDNRSVLTAFEVAGPFVYLVIGVILYERMREAHPRLLVLAVTVLMFAGLIRDYSFVYRDEPVRYLTSKVEKGIYKGLYTTQERKEFVESLEDILTEQIDRKESVCCVTREPAAYLMAKADICAPWTWEAQFLARGYTSAAPLLDYFSAIGEIPDVIVATDTVTEDFYNNPKYEITGFINSCYDLCYSGSVGEDRLWLWKVSDSCHFYGLKH